MCPFLGDRWPKEPQHSGFCAKVLFMPHGRPGSQCGQWFHLMTAQAKPTTKTTRNWSRNRASCSDVCLDLMYEELQWRVDPDVFKVCLILHLLD